MFFLTYENWYEIVFDISFSKTPHKKRTLRTSHFKKHKKTVFSFFFIIFFSTFLYYAQKLKIKTKVEIENWKTLIFQMPYKMPPTSHIYISNLSDLHFSQSKKLTCFKSFVVSVDLSLTKSRQIIFWIWPFIFYIIILIVAVYAPICTIMLSASSKYSFSEGFAFAFLCLLNYIKVFIRHNKESTLVSWGNSFGYDSHWLTLLLFDH